MVELSKKLMPREAFRLQLSSAMVNVIAEELQIAMAFPDCVGPWGRSIVPDATVFLWERIPFDANGEVEIHLKFIQTGR